MAIRDYQGISPKIGNNVYIDEMAVVIGDVVIGDDSSVWPMAVIRGDVHSIRIGDKTSVQDGAVLHVTHDGPHSPGGGSLQIGNQVTVGHNVTLHACNIDDRVLIGMGSIVLDGAHLESDIILGAGSTVPPNKTLQSGYLYVGSPAKKLRPLNDKEKQFLSYTANNYVKLQQTHQ